MIHQGLSDTQTQRSVGPSGAVAGGRRKPGEKKKAFLLSGNYHSIERLREPDEIDLFSLRNVEKASVPKFFLFIIPCGGAGAARRKFLCARCVGTKNMTPLRRALDFKGPSRQDYAPLRSSNSGAGWLWPAGDGAVPP